MTMKHMKKLLVNCIGLVAVPLLVAVLNVVVVITLSLNHIVFRTGTAAERLSNRLTAWLMEVEVP